MIRLETVIFIQLLMGIPIMILLQKTIELKKQVTQTIKEVTDYLNFITEEEQEEKNKQEGIHTERKNRRLGDSKEESQSQLIQTVLREYFP